MFYKRDKKLALAILFSIFTYVLMVASWHSWDGGWSWGSRLLTPIVPVLGFLTAPVIHAAWRKRGDMFVISLFAILGLGIGLLALARNPVQTLVDFVVYGDVAYHETINTVDRSWVALQIRSLREWTMYDIDAYTLARWANLFR